MEKLEPREQRSMWNRSNTKRRLRLAKDPSRILSQNRDLLSCSNYIKTSSTMQQRQQTVLSSIPLRALPLLLLLLDDLRLAQQLDSQITNSALMGRTLPEWRAQQQQKFDEPSRFRFSKMDEIDPIRSVLAQLHPSLDLLPLLHSLLLLPSLLFKREQKRTEIGQIRPHLPSRPILSSATNPISRTLERPVLLQRALPQVVQELEPNNSFTSLEKEEESPLVSLLCTNRSNLNSRMEQLVLLRLVDSQQTKINSSRLLVLKLDRGFKKPKETCSRIDPLLRKPRTLRPVITVVEAS